MSDIGPQTFPQTVLDAFPGLSEAFAAAGTLDAQIGAFAQFAQGAKSRGDWPVYERCMALADRLFTSGTAELIAAFRGAFFEPLDFEGSRGPAAWQLLPPALQTAWKQMDAENRRLMALPQSHRKDSASSVRALWGGTPKPPAGRGGAARGPKGPRGPQGSRGPKGRGGRRGGRGGGRGGRS